MRAGLTRYDPTVAKLVVRGDRVVVRLNPLEKVAAFRRNVTVPLRAITSVTVVDRPWDHLIPERVTTGFAASTAPGATVATIGPRASSGDGKALLVVYRNRRSVVIEIDTTSSRHSLVVVSVRDPDAAVAMIAASTLAR
jgi:hypothetical protein